MGFCSSSAGSPAATVTVASPLSVPHAASSAKNSLGPFALTFSPYQVLALTQSERRARVSATYIVRRSSMISCCCRSRLKCESTPSNRGRIEASPRSSKSSE